MSTNGKQSSWVVEARTGQSLRLCVNDCVSVGAGRGFPQLESVINLDGLGLLIETVEGPPFSVFMIDLSFSIWNSQPNSTRSQFIFLSRSNALLTFGGQDFYRARIRYCHIPNEWRNVLEGGHPRRTARRQLSIHNVGCAIDTRLHSVTAHWHTHTRTVRLTRCVSAEHYHFYRVSVFAERLVLRCVLGGNWL